MSAPRGLPRPHKVVKGRYAGPPPGPDWLDDEAQPIPHECSVSGSVWYALEAVEDMSDLAGMDSAAAKFVKYPWDLPLLATAFIRRDFAVAVAVRVAEQALPRVDRPYPVQRCTAVLRRLRVDEAEIAAAIGSLGRPPSLALLAWAAEATAA